MVLGEFSENFDLVPAEKVMCYSVLYTNFYSSEYGLVFLSLESVKGVCVNILYC